VDEIIFDAEHFFDGYKSDPAYALQCVQAADEAGLPVVTEVLDPRMVGVVSDYADALQIGARNMQNYISVLRDIKIHFCLAIKSARILELS